MAQGLSCSEACGIFPDQGSNLCLLHWQVDSLPLSHQGTCGWDFKFYVSNIHMVLTMHQVLLDRLYKYHLILTTLPSGASYPHSTDEETEAQRSYSICPRSNQNSASRVHALNLHAKEALSCL